MKKLGKLVQKILTIIVILLILGTIGIFVYPSIADKTELDDKAVSFLAKQADKLVEETTEAGSEGEEVGTEVNADGEMADEDSVIEEVVVSKPADEASVEEVVQDDSRTQTWTAEEKEALKKVYGTILNWMGLGTHNLLFYEMKEFGGTEYYTFQVVDDFGDAFERLLFFDDAKKEVYWHEEDGDLIIADSEDCIYSGKVQGQENVSYDSSDWKKVMDEYLKAMYVEQDGEKASTYVDSSCYYLAALSENNRKRFIEATQELQDKIIAMSESYESQKKNKTIDDYTFSYEILDTETYVDEYDLDWVDVYIAFNLDVKQHGQTDLMGEYYVVRLRDYPYGWRVASFSEDY